MSLTVAKRITKISRTTVETIACFGSILGKLHNSKIKNTALKRKSYCFAQSCGTLFSPFVWIKTTWKRLRNWSEHTTIDYCHSNFVHCYSKNVINNPDIGCFAHSTTWPKLSSRKILMTSQWLEHPNGDTEILPRKIFSVVPHLLPSQHHSNENARVHATPSHLSYDDTMLYFHVTSSLTVGKNIFFS